MNLSRRQFLGLIPAIPVAVMAVVKAKRSAPLVRYGGERLWVYDGSKDTIQVATTAGTKTVAWPEARGVTHALDSWPTRYDHYNVYTG